MNKISFCKKKALPFISAVLVVSMLWEVLTPAVALSLTSGPSQPEFAGITESTLVNPFTGAFSYSIPVLSIPGPNGVGYTMNLSYNNDLSVENESSWVGFGWSLNAGAINRTKRGFPDDYKNSEVIYWRNARDNKTTRAALRAGLEFLSQERLDKAFENEVKSGNMPPAALGIPLSMKTAFTVQYNNHTGYDYLFDIGGSLASASMNVNFSENGIGVDAEFRPHAYLVGFAVSGISNWIGSPSGLAKWGLDLGAHIIASQPGVRYFFKTYSGANQFKSPLRVVPYSGKIITFEGAIEDDVFPNSGLEGGIAGSWTTIKSIPKYKENAYGYLHSSAVGSNTESMDYFTEKEDSYSDEDQYLPIPFSNADYFSLTGAGINGGFRAYHRAQGHFRPAFTKSKLDIGHANLDIHLVGEIGIGMAAGKGSYSLQTEGWEDNGLSFSNNIGDGEPVFFRANGDRGGAMVDAGDDIVQLDCKDDEDPNWYGGRTISEYVNNGHRVGRSTYIGYNLNMDMLRRPVFDCNNGLSNVYYRAFSRRNNILHSYVKRDDPAIQNSIGEFSVVGSDGMTYVYGLPVYSRGEVNMSYGLKGLSVENIDNNFLAFKAVVPEREKQPFNLQNDERYADNENLDGIEYPTPYATTYLLTEVVSPDYVDRTNNGPTPDDMGGYVVFNYTPLNDRVLWEKTNADSLDYWYKWRVPYRGLSYSRNSLSDPYDDAGSFSYGYKEVYFLQSIETKSHKALFYTSPRKDSYEAPATETEASGSKTATSVDPAPVIKPEEHQKLEKLDKIELWSKDPSGNVAKLLSTSYFEYDYTLCQGLPNAEDNGGKLTLKRLWFEYEGAVNARISPYEFGYEYRKTGFYPSKVQSQYHEIIGHGDDFSDGVNSEQNPNYSPFALDAWGNYQYGGDLQYEKLKPWVNQAPSNEYFDPAAWQLKWIKLPSGGEIHIQYEQNDYGSVQHRKPMVMTPILGRKSSSTGDRYTYSLDLNSMGITKAEEKERLVTLMRNQFLEEGEYIYFKFLYAVEGSNPDPDLCTSEYINGYASVTSVEEENGNIYIQIGDVNQNTTLPDKVCNDFYKSARQGILDVDCGNREANLEGNGESEAEQVGSAVFAAFQAGPDRMDYATDVSIQRCKEINFEYSYLRIPTIKDKKGGGIRTKRVLTYDPGLEGDDVALYGTEYTYKMPDGSSSGVATTEPISIREENALVHLIPRRINPANYTDTIISGKSMRQQEGPLGESLLPGASIGYSRVVAHNIHKGKSDLSFSVYEYYTARDYPLDLNSAQINDPDGLKLKKNHSSLITDRSEPYPLDVAIYSKVSTYLNATQGYRFVLNNMHGQKKSITQYAGMFDPVHPHTDNAVLSQQNRYEYYQPWESIPVLYTPTMDNSSSNDKQGIDYEYPGKVVEVVTESRRITDFVGDINIQADIGAYLGYLIPLPVGSAMGRYQRDKKVLRTHVTSKVISYPTVLKSITTTKDGSVNKVEFVAFDPETGSAVLTKSYDEFNNLQPNNIDLPLEGVYYSLGIPAWQYYRNFTQMARSQGLVLKSSDDNDHGFVVNKKYLRTQNGDEHYLIINSMEPDGARRFLESVVTGDLIQLFSNSELDISLGLYHIGNIAGNRIQLFPVSYSLSDTQPNVTAVSIQIVKTARNNRLGASIGALTTYGYPIESTGP